MISCIYSHKVEYIYNRYYVKGRGGREFGKKRNKTKFHVSRILTTNATYCEPSLRASPSLDN